MIAHSTRCIALAFAVALLPLPTGCQDRPTTYKGAELSSRLVGEWTSDPFVSQVGVTTERFCFGPNGDIWRAGDIAGIPGSLKNNGTYRVDADRVTMSWPSTGSEAVLTVTWSGDRLILNDDRLGPRSYRHTSSKC
jgi:hypothetical protein